MNKIRFKYSKTGRAKYISHLDLTSVMQRAFLRAGIDLKYSEGFNPHPYISAALPLSVGCESICELMDVAVNGVNLPDITKIILPEGIKILDVYASGRKFNDIAWIKINGVFQYNNSEPANIVTVVEKIKNCFSNESIVITKKTKRGIKEIDIAPYVKNTEIIFANTGVIGTEYNVLITAVISAKDPVINTLDLENVLPEDLKADHTEFKRIEIYDNNMLLFK